ncbi:uncharacterized protein LOC117173402 [Belonocnema kinseyi]|uniref:uncharacterized protein LOC117173402 n=1 Tax=Belonocnema kinseyi TaxID=2817044 RepID=UPI00143E0D6F|nr:uncharacterized protein LOC117173402 [Belonocnema kinseyi]
MKIHVGALLLTVAIFISFIELSSQYNDEVLEADTWTLLDNLGIFFNVTNDLDILVSDGHNQKIFGLIDDVDNKLICALEKYMDDYWVRALMVGDKQVKADGSNTYEWTQADTDLYQLDFGKILNNTVYW